MTLSNVNIQQYKTLKLKNMKMSVVRTHKLYIKFQHSKKWKHSKKLMEKNEFSKRYVTLSFVNIQK